jgi:type I restriction enzyme S subunit
MRFDDLAEINPSVPIRKGEIRPFIDMSALPQHARDVSEVGERGFKGSGSRFQNGDTLIARITPCLENGKGALIHSLPEGVPGFGSTEFIVARARSERDTRFVYYLTRSEEFREIAISRMEGTSGRQRVSWQQIASIEIPDLRPDEREEIGDILGLLDDKIELNRRMAATLEEMARALYRSWFVDFDPVKAKAEGLAPAFMDETTAALFPDRFGDDGLPDGWTMRRLGDILTLNYGKALKKDIRQAGPFPVYGSGGSNSSHIEALVSSPTVIVGRKGTVGSIFWSPRGCWPIDTTYYASSPFPMVYALHTLRGLPLSEMNTDAAVPGLNRENAYRLVVPFPGEALISAFADRAASIQEKVDTIDQEVSTLGILRDTLLPKLMSGELWVGEARDQIEEVA